jgi:tetratricopeptide (TPR) repeat protein
VRALVLAALVLVLAGCFTLPLRPGVSLLDRGDALLEQGDYVSAMAAYDEFLKKYPDDRLAGSVQARRDTASAIRAARDEIARLRSDLLLRENEMTRLRQEIDRLRADLETIKQTDLRLERKR